MLRKFATAASTVFLFGSSSEAVTLQLLAVGIIIVISLYYEVRPTSAQFCSRAACPP